MTCKAYETAWVDWCEGNLSKSHKDELTEHLKDCKACETSLQELENIFGTLKQIKKNPPKAPLFYFSTLLSRTRARIRKETGEEISLWEKLRALLRLPQLIPVALSIIILVLTFSNQIEDHYLAIHQDQYVMTLAMEINAHHIYDPSLVDMYETLEFLNTDQVETLIQSLEQKLGVIS